MVHKELLLGSSQGYRGRSYDGGAKPLRGTTRRLPERGIKG